MIEFSVIRAKSDGSTVIICAATPNSFACSNTQSWGYDLIVAFESKSGEATYIRAYDEIIANLYQGHNEHLYVHLSASPSYMKIKLNGLMATGNGNITYCDKSNKFQVALVTNLVGRVRYTDQQGSYSC